MFGLTDPLALEPMQQFLSTLKLKAVAHNSSSTRRQSDQAADMRRYLQNFLGNAAGDQEPYKVEPGWPLARVPGEDGKFGDQDDWSMEIIVNDEGTQSRTLMQARHMHEDLQT